MQIRPRKRMGFLLIALSPLFLFNPDIAVFDLLPDVIGYMMLSMGLSSLSYLNHHFEESAKRFHRMVAISAARLAFVVVLFGLVNSTDRPTTMLLGNFVFGVLSRRRREERVPPHCGCQAVVTYHQEKIRI